MRVLWVNRAIPFVGGYFGPNVLEGGYLGPSPQMTSVQQDFKKLIKLTHLHLENILEGMRERGR